MTGKIVTVFGGSGFVGRLVVRALCRHGWRVRVAMRRPHLGGDLRMAGDVGQVQLVQANVRNRPSIARALEGADAAVNLVGILVERGAQTFQGTQALGARNIATLAAEAGVKRFVYMSSIGADAGSRSNYARTKAEAEQATLEAIPTATILRPSIIFGPEDGFFTRFAEMARLTPVLPMVGGATKFQPVYGGDVAEALANALETPEAQGKTYELGGPRIYTMKDLLQYITREIDRPRMMLPIPFTVASPLGYTNGALASLPAVGWVFGPVLTGDQVQMLKRDNVANPKLPGLAQLGVASPETVESIAPTYLWRHRPHGQFQKPLIDEISRVDA
ncbi:MAG: NAD(P)H-binding protein [Alphaproteobacteria bacterium]|nr:NAD(P)H-binding protein [Alphaproteobacteria bacterium]